MSATGVLSNCPNTALSPDHLLLRSRPGQRTLFVTRAVLSWTSIGSYQMLCDRILPEWSLNDLNSIDPESACTPCLLHTPEYKAHLDGHTPHAAFVMSTSSQYLSVPQSIHRPSQHRKDRGLRHQAQSQEHHQSVVADAASSSKVKLEDTPLGIHAAPPAPTRASPVQTARTLSPTPASSSPTPPSHTLPSPPSASSTTVPYHPLHKKLPT